MLPGDALNGTQSLQLQSKIIFLTYPNILATIFKIFSNGEWIEDTSSSSSSEFIIDETNPIDMIGMVTTQNSLELSELKQQVEAIGQGVVEIILNQQMGGM